MDIAIYHNCQVERFANKSELWDWTEKHFGPFRAADITEWVENARIGDGIAEYDIILVRKNFAS